MPGLREHLFGNGPSSAVKHVSGRMQVPSPKATADVSISFQTLRLKWVRFSGALFKLFKNEQQKSKLLETPSERVHEVLQTFVLVILFNN